MAPLLPKPRDSANPNLRLPFARSNERADGTERGDLDELREAVDRVEAYRAFQPDRFDRRALNRQLRALAQEREVRP